MMCPPHTAHVRVMSRLVRTVCRGTPLSNVMSPQACKNHTSWTMPGQSCVVTLLQLRTGVAAGAAARTLHVRSANSAEFVSARKTHRMCHVAFNINIDDAPNLSKSHFAKISSGPPNQSNRVALLSCRRVSGALATSVALPTHRHR